MPDSSDFLFETSFTVDDWKESITEGERPEVTISRVGSASHLTIICDFAKFKSACKFILGYSWVDENYFLRRFTPAFHPIFPWLFARAITSVSFAKVETTDDSTTSSGKAIDKQTLNWTDAVPFTVYRYAKITIEFCEVRYDVLTDDEVEVDTITPSNGYLEYTRYVERLPQSYVELAHVDGGQLKAYAPGIALVDQKPFITAPYILSRQEKSAFKLIWREVPEDMLYDENGYSAKLAAIQKKVNKYTFMGRVPGTLLCESAVGEKNPVPIATDINNRLTFTYDVTFEMKEFNPTRADTSVDIYGWNLLPAVRNSAGSDGEVLWDYVCYTHDGTKPVILPGGTGNTPFGYYDFFSVFRHRLLP